MFAGVAGDFSPLTIEVAHGGPRVVPPALLVAMAVGLGSMDMPIPAVSEWDWLNWKFPRAVHAGDTIYARWTLTQKRPPVGSAPTSIVVWRVDVHTADGAMCAEGEVGASVRREVASSARQRAVVEPAATVAAPAARRRRRRRAPTGANGPRTAAEGTAAAIEPPATAAPAASGAKSERTAGPARRRRRRRSPNSPAARNGDGAAPSAPVPASEPAAPKPTPVAGASATASPLSRVIRRLRRT